MSNSELGREIARGVTGVGSTKVISLALTTLASLVVARQLGPSGYGQLAFVMAILHLLAIPSNNALNPLLAREVAKYDERGDWNSMRGLLRWTATRSTALGALAIVPLLVWIIVRPGDLDAMLLIGAAIVLLWTWAARVSGALQGLKKVVLAQSFDWLWTPGCYLLLLGAIWIFGSFTPTIVLAASGTALLVSVVAGQIALRGALPIKIGDAAPHLDSQAWLKSWGAFVAMQAASVANLRVPVLLLGILSTQAETGLYRVGENIASLLAMSLLVVNAVITPYVTRLHETGQLTELGALAKRMARLALAVSIPAAVLGLVFGPELLELLFGEAYVDAYAALAVMLVAQVINIACGSVALILNMTGHEQHTARTLALALVVNVAISAILIPEYGAMGAATGAAVSMIVWNVTLLVRIRRLFGINPAAI